MISVNKVNKRYGKKMVLNDLSITFPKGKITSLIGGNGTGKSTLLGVVSKLLEQDSGKVFVVDKEISDISTKEFAKKLSVLKQSNFTHIRLKVRELVGFGRFPYNRGRKMTQEDHRIIDRALKFMDLDKISDQYLDELSGGQRQRAYLAMVLAQDTEYILLDEPLNNLDMRYSVQIMKLLKRMTHELNKTVIIIVHDINIAAHYSDFIATVKEGSIKHFGPTNEIIKPEILKDIFELDFEVIRKNGCSFCLYFN